MLTAALFLSRRRSPRGRRRMPRWSPGGSSADSRWGVHDLRALYRRDRARADTGVPRVPDPVRHSDRHPRHLYRELVARGIGPGVLAIYVRCGNDSAVVFFAGLFFVPEARAGSLFAENSTGRGRCWPHRRSRHAETELAAIRDAVETETGSVRELFRKGLREPSSSGSCLRTRQSVGINAIMYYSPTIFLNAGFQDNSSAFPRCGGGGVVNFLFTIAAVFWVDRFGRRPLLLAGIAGMFLSLAGASVIFRTAGRIRLDARAILSFVALYAVSLGPIAWVLVSEIFPNRLRGIAKAICMSALYISDFIVSFTYPRLLETFGPNVFLMYAGICAAGFAYVFFAVPETKGRPLEEIERMWASGA